MPGSIRVKLVGGLGNQLFCYYAGAAISAHNSAQLILDVSAANPSVTGHQRSSLVDFELPGKWQWVEAKNREKSSILLRSKLLLERKTGEIDTLARIRKIRNFTGENVGWNPEVLLSKPGETLWGFFQSWKYVDLAIKGNFPHRIQLKNPSVDLRSMINRALIEKPISIHIRRGDFTTDDKWGVLTRDYYHDALKAMRRSGLDGPVWIFTDSPNEARDFMEGEVISGKLRPAEEMILMSHCASNILANSTFSWWGAWMNTESTLTTYPEPWFKSLPSIPELTPPNWVPIKHSW